MAKKSGLILLFREEKEWVPFIWCFGHCLELVLKDTLKGSFAPVDESLTHLYYLYKKYSKKHRELKNLYQLMKDQYEFHGDGVRPVKSTGTQWINHKLCTMEQLVEKFGLYCQHLEHAIPEIKNSKDRATLPGKFEKLIDAKVLLHSGFFSDILPAAKVFSLTTQKSDINIISIVEKVESIKQDYEKLLKKFKGNPKTIFTDLPTLSAIITEIEGNEDGESIYQDLKFYTRKSCILKPKVLN